MYSYLKDKLAGVSEETERWFGAYMALNVKGLFPWDDRVGNTCDLIVKACWNGDLQLARKWSQNLHQHIMSKKEEDERYEKLDDDQANSWFEAFKDMWSWGGEEVIKEKVEEETDIELEKQGEGDK